MYYELFIVVLWFTIVMGGVTFIQQYFFLTYSRHWLLLAFFIFSFRGGWIGGSD